MNDGDKWWDVMISISTSKIANEEDVGLVSNHAYAVLELIEIDGKRFMLVLNPWWWFCWKGWFSLEDSTSWTPELKKKLSYEKLREKDWGIFWILFEDAIKAFANIELNWNPNILKYHKTKFGHWKHEDMKDGYEDLWLNP